MGSATPLERGIGQKADLRGRIHLFEVAFDEGRVGLEDRFSHRFDGVQNRPGHDAEDQADHGDWCHRSDLPQAQVLGQFFMLVMVGGFSEGTEAQLAGHVEQVHRTEDHAGRGDGGEPRSKDAGVSRLGARHGGEGADQAEELAHESVETGKANTGEDQHDEEERPDQ